MYCFDQLVYGSKQIFSKNALATKIFQESNRQDWAKLTHDRSWHHQKFLSVQNSPNIWNRDVQLVYYSLTLLLRTSDVF